MSQVVIVHTKTGEICLCVDFRRLNAISIHDSFPLPCLEEALQAVQATVWFSSFDLAQGYLQMAMEEADILKTAFRAGSSDLYEFTHMPFGLTNAVFSHLKEFNLKIKPKKSYFFQTSVTFLGHILSADGVSPNPEKVAKIKDWPIPKTPKETFILSLGLPHITVASYQISQNGLDHSTP